MVGKRLKDAAILIVDDQESNVLLLRRLLEEDGYTCLLTTTDPRAVHDLFLQSQPDLLLLDLLMPHLDGYQVMAGLRAQQPAASDFFPILVLTADITPQARRKALAMGATDFLTKPFDPVEVLLRIHNLLETRFLYREVREQNRTLEEKVRQRTEALRALSHQLVDVQEAERRYISRELHDEAGQSITSLLLRLGQLEKESDPSLRTDCVEELKEMATAILDNLHRLAMDLRPASLDHLGLVPALRQYVQLVGERQGMVTQFEAIGFDNGRLPPEAETALYRIVQEALTNVVKHARASQADVLLQWQGERVVVVVEDDGVGFDPGSSLSGRLGLLGMQERAEMLGGSLAIESRPGAGTTIAVNIPTKQ